MYEELKEILNHAQNIVFFGGAGVSTESGIPDFRSETGLYSAQSEFGYRPEDMLSGDFFKKHTETFFDYYKKNLVARYARPNKAHLALAKLEQQGKLSAVITQNVDGLHQMAGSKNVFELHGSIQRNRCLCCGKSYSLDYILSEDHCDNGVPKCADCGSVVKPDVVLYGEMLDDDCIQASVAAIESADVLIIGGTSLVVYPAAAFVQFFRGDKLVLINTSNTNMDKNADLVIHAPIGEVLGECLKIK